MRLVSTPVAAEALGVDASTLRKWARRGLVEPDAVTAGHQYRWDVERLRADLKRRHEEQRRQRDEE